MKIDDLPDTPTPAATPTPDPDPRSTDWYQFTQEIEDLLVTHGWAQDTLLGIQQSVEKTHTVSEGQQRAVTNIASSHGRGGSRRYEGYSRRYR